MKRCSKCAVEKLESEFNFRQPGKLTARCKSCLNSKSKEWRQKHPEHIRLYNQKWHRNNRAYLNDYVSRRCNINPEIRLRKALASRVIKALKGINKSNKTMELVGCSIEQLREWLEAQFSPGMTWQNHGVRGWHIDHIRPCSSFDLTDYSQQRMCFNFTNLQPLWAGDNRSKGAKIYGK